MRSRATWAGALLLCCARAARAATPGASDDAEASYSQAIVAYDHHSYADALRGFQHAYALKPSYKILYNVGLSEVALDDPARALDAFDAYLAQGGDKAPPARAAELKATMAKLNAKVGWLMIENSDPAAQLTLDGAPVAGDSARSARVNPGEHRVCATIPAKSPVCQSAEVNSGAHVSVRWSQAPAQPPRAVIEQPEPSRTPPLADSDRSSTYRVVAWTTAGAFTAGAVVTGLLALGARGEEKDAEKTKGITRPELDDAQSKVSHLALGTDLLLGGAAIATGVALYLQLSSPHEGGQPARSATALVLRPTGVDFALVF